MRNYLTLALEAISIVTAVGVVISTLIYSLIFTKIGVSYIAIASLSDILRDSLRLLILVVTCVVALGPIFLLAMHKMSHGSLVKRWLLAIGMGIYSAITLLLLGYVMVAVGGLSYGAVINLESLYAVIAISAFTTGSLLLGGVVTKPLFGKGEYSYSRAIVAADKRLLFFTPTLWFLNSAFIVSMVMADQLTKGLPMTVHFDSMKVCPKERPVVVWIGDSKAVIKCRVSGKYIVKVM
jgi:hypothetical protein